MSARPKASTSRVSCFAKASAAESSSLVCGRGADAENALLASDDAFGAEHVVSSFSMCVSALPFLVNSKPVLGFKASSASRFCVVCVPPAGLMNDMMLGLGTGCGRRHFVDEKHEDLKPYPDLSQTLEQIREYLPRVACSYDEVKTLILPRTGIPSD